MVIGHPYLFSIVRDWMIRDQAIHKNDKKRDNDQTTYKNRILTHSLRSNQPLKPNYKFCRAWPKTVRTWSITANFPNFWFYFEPSMNMRKPNMTPNQIYNVPLLGNHPLPLPRPTTSNQGTPEACPVSHQEVFPLCSPSLILCQRQVMMALSCSHFDGIHLFPEWHDYFTIIFVSLLSH